MKQINLVLFLLVLSVINSKNIKSKFFNSQSDSPTPLHSAFTLMGNLKIQDVGSSVSTTWICGADGKIYKSSTTDVQYILTNKLDGECFAIDVDYKGLPWVVTQKGDVFRLKEILGSSAVWLKVYDGSTAKAIDIGCGQDITVSCYIAVDAQKVPYYFNGENFVKSDTYTANTIIKRIDVGSGQYGDRLVVVNEENFILQLEKRQKPLSLGLIGIDVSIGYNNQILVSNNFGIFLKSRCSKFFVKINDLYSKALSVGKDLWTIGQDSYIYQGRLFNYVSDCP